MFGIAVISSAPYFIALGVIDLIFIFCLIKKLPNGARKQLIIVGGWIFPAFYLYYGIQAIYVLGIPIPIFKQEAIRQINICNVESLKRYSGDKIASISFAEGEYVTKNFPRINYIVTNWDFDALLEAANAVQDRCSYNFEGFARGIEGFKKEYRSVYITLDKAAQMLNSCTVDAVAYVGHTIGDPAVGWKGMTGIPTGIRLLSKEKLRQIWVKEDLRTQTLPIFCEAKKRCPDLRISCD